MTISTFANLVEITTGFLTFGYFAYRKLSGSPHSGSSQKYKSLIQFKADLRKGIFSFKRSKKVLSKEDESERKKPPE